MLEQEGQGAGVRKKPSSDLPEPPSGVEGMLGFPQPTHASENKAGQDRKMF